MVRENLAILHHLKKSRKAIMKGFCIHAKLGKLIYLSDYSKFFDSAVALFHNDLTGLRPLIFWVKGIRQCNK